MNKNATTTCSPTTSQNSDQAGAQQQNSAQDGERLELQRTVSGPPYTIFTAKAKMFIVVAVSISSLISPFGATTFYPALDTIAADYGVSPTLINLSLTTYMVSCFDSHSIADYPDHCHARSHKQLRQL